MLAFVKSGRKLMEPTLIEFKRRALAYHLCREECARKCGNACIPGPRSFERADEIIALLDASEKIARLDDAAKAPDDSALRDALTEAVQWYDAVQIIAKNRGVKFALDYEPSWLIAARKTLGGEEE